MEQSKFSAITAAVYDAWQFSWPPVIASAIANVVVSFIYPSGFQNLTHSVVAAIIQYAGSMAEFGTALETLGLKPLIPIVSFVLLIALLYLVTMIVVWFSNLPPYIAYNPDHLFFHRISDKERLLLFRKYPLAEDFNQAYYMALKDSKKEIEHEEFYSSRAANYYQFHNFLKFAVGVICLTVLVAAINHDASLVLLRRAFVLLMIVPFFWVLGLVGLLYAQEQDFNLQGDAIRSLLQADVATLLKKKMTSEEKAKLSRTPTVRWWSIYVFNRYPIYWFKRTFRPLPRSRSFNDLD
jgi:hypothetical protein